MIESEMKIKYHSLVMIMIYERYIWINHKALFKR